MLLCVVAPPMAGRYVAQVSHRDLQTDASQLPRSAAVRFSLAHESLFVMKFSVFSCNLVRSQCDVPALIFSISPGSRTGDLFSRPSALLNPLVLAE